MRVDSRAAIIERRSEASRAPQWEYRAARMDLDADLGQFGAEGWELVAVVPVPHDPMTAMYHFKRRRI
jgi:hypothetical protein